MNCWKQMANHYDDCPHRVNELLTVIFILRPRQQQVLFTSFKIYKI